MKSTPISPLACVLLAHVLVRTVDAVCSNNVACFPTPVDILDAVAAGNINFNVSSVCGNPPEFFCSKSDCSMLCNASDPANRHPKEYMTDGYNELTFWKSKNLEQPVTIQVDLNQKLILHQVIVTFQYDYPSYTRIERSQNYGNSYFIIHQNAINCQSSAGELPSATYKPLTTVCMTILTSDSSNAV